MFHDVEISNAVNHWLQGDDSAFETIFYYYRPRLLRYTLRYLKDISLAEDLTTEILVLVWKHKVSITTANTFENYLFTIARNQLIKSWKKKVNILLSLSVDKEHIADSAGANDAVLFKELDKRYRDGLASLPEQRRRIFLLHREQNFSYREIAEQLKISPKTVENQIAATLKQLRIQLAQYLSALIL